MGQELSIPEQLYAAVKRDDAAWMEDALQRWQQQRRKPADRQAASILSWEDPTSRLTPLMLAAGKCRLEIAKSLLGAGADPNFVSRAAVHGPRGGTALHEAVKAHHTAVVDLLLHHGADPYLENAEGYTAMDVAVSEADPLLVRRLESRALFAGYLMQQVSQSRAAPVDPSAPHTGSLAASGGDSGQSTGHYRMRWVVIAPRISLLSGGRPTGTARVELLTFDDWDDATPKTQAWLDGAQTLLSQSECGEWVGRVRLHPDHQEPVDAAGPYDGGWPLAFGAPRVPPLGNATLSAFTDCASRPLDYLAAASAARMSTAAATLTGAGAAAAAAAAVAARGTVAGIAAPSLNERQPSGRVGLDGSSFGQPDQNERRVELQRQLRDTQLALCQLRMQQRRQHIEVQLHRLLQQQQQQQQLMGDARALPESVPAPQSWSGQLQLQLQGWMVQLVPAVAPPLSHVAPLANAAAAAATRRSISLTGGPPALQAAYAPPATADTTTATTTATDAAVGASMRLPVFATENDDHCRDHAASDNIGDACVICLSNPRSIGFLHKESVHRCVCAGCAPLLRIGGPCPLCREPIAAALKVY